MDSQFGAVHELVGQMADSLKAAAAPRQDEMRELAGAVAAKITVG